MISLSSLCLTLSIFECDAGYYEGPEIRSASRAYQGELRGTPAAVFTGNGKVAFVAFVGHIASMVTSHRNPSSGRLKQSSSAVLPERTGSARVANMLVSRSTKQADFVQVVRLDGESVELPSVLADEELLSTQDAAEILGVSRQYLIRLIDRGEIIAVKVGTHRRLRAYDVKAYKDARDAKRLAALDRLTALSEDLGGYDMGEKP